jgi:hypothetical protein
MSAQLPGSPLPPLLPLPLPLSDAQTVPAVAAIAAGGVMPVSRETRMPSLCKSIVDG